MLHKIGIRIGSYRKERNMSQEELASILQVSRQTVSKWETGDTLPDTYNCVAIANLFHVSLDELVLGVTGQFGGTSYSSALRENRKRTNLWAIIVGATGSTIFASSLALLNALNIERTSVGLIMAFIIPILMFCWGYAIWGFIKVARINHELKYLEQMELINISKTKE